MRIKYTVPGTFLRDALGGAHRRYTRLINFRAGWRGHIWHERFHSFVMDERHLLAAARYVERTPVRARLCAKRQDWPWSSARAHTLLDSTIASWACAHCWSRNLFGRRLAARPTLRISGIWCTLTPAQAARLVRTPLSNRWSEAYNAP
jgi:hypothetical protein